MAAAYDGGPMESVALDVGCFDDRTHGSMSAISGQTTIGCRAGGPFTPAGQYYDSVITYLFHDLLNLIFRRVPAAGSRNAWKTRMDAIPDDSELADTRTP